MHYLIFLILLCGSLNVGAYNPKFESDNYFTSKTYSKTTLEKFALHWADKFKLDKKIVFAVIMQESSWRHIVVSHKGARGLMQLLPSTAKDLGMTVNESLFNPYTNIYYGCKYLRYLLDRYDGNYALTLVAYYSGMKWSDYIREGRLRDSKFKAEIIAYASEVLARSNYTEVSFDQEEDKATKINDL